MSKRIVYTRDDGGVSITEPSETCIGWMRSGGFYEHQLNSLMPRGFLETQIERWVAENVHKDTARKFVRALAFGGMSRQESYALIRDKDCPGTGHEVWDVDELPDRWFRNAWTRSHNGGPIGIDIEKAKPIQWERVRRAVYIENEKRAKDFQTMPRPLEPDMGRIAEEIRNATDESDLRRVWHV